MRPLKLVVLALPAILGLIAWRSWSRPEEIRPAETPKNGRLPAREEVPPPPEAAPDRVALWKSVGEVRSGEPQTDGDAFLFLVEQALKEAVAERAFGIRPSPADLEAELERLRADPETREALARIERLFRGDRAAFLREIIRPAFVDSALWMRFSNDPEIHRPARAAAEDIAARARQDPRPFARLGSPGAEFGRARIPRVPGAPDPKGHPLPRLESISLDPAALAGVREGQLYPGVVATRDAFVVLRVDRRRDDDAEVATWTVPKAPYLPWLIRQGQDLAGTLDGPELRAHLGTLDPGHWLRQVFR
jgi:hypothetical protein